MKVFKFGGASVKDADSVRNLLKVISLHDVNSLLVVVSAMGKTTNALESVWQAFIQNSGQHHAQLQKVIDFHSEILEHLFQPDSLIYEKVQKIWNNLTIYLRNAPNENVDLEYDQIVSNGELVSTLVVNEFLNESGISSFWLDARTVIKTDSLFREANVDWTESVRLIKDYNSKVKQPSLIVTQGFIGKDEKGNTTTLGREGSDYSAAIFGFALKAESVTIWKDVPGMLNADPKFFEDTQRLPKISYKEALELSYYGATIIHPKTLKPLQNSGIPLYVKSFIAPNEPGTEIQESTEDDALIPSFIFKTNQVLISITPRDFSFIMEENLSIIFALIAKERVRINLMQNSALSFSICVNQDVKRIQKLIASLQSDYQVLYNEDVTLITVRHYNEKVIERLTYTKKVLVEQRSRSTARFVVSEVQR